MAKRSISLNKGAQHDFVLNKHRHSAYIGGVGAGKTLALVVRGLQYASQPVPEGTEPPYGCLLTKSYPALKDIVYPAVYKVGGKSGLDVIDREIKNQTDRKFILKNGAQVLMRSLDQPDRLRGIELTWFGVDEGRNFEDDYAYNKVMVGRLRQPGYHHAGWVSSTPNGYDWMWKLFHPDSPNRMPDAEWYNASTYQNKRNLPPEYILDLETQWKGRWFEQEVLGKFVGVMHGAVFPDFDPAKHVAAISYSPDLPLYSFWDFGIGDASVCLFAQLAYNPRLAQDLSIVHEPQLRIVGSIEASGLNVSEFALKYHRWLIDNTTSELYPNGRPCTASWGDPAGGQRTQVTGTSVLQAFGTHGIYIRPAPKRPIDEGIIIVQNLMLGEEQFLVNENEERVIKAIQTYHWSTDTDGNRKSNEPVHDWTSHTCSALRYGALGTVGLGVRRSLPPTEEPIRGTMGYITQQLMHKKKEQELTMNAEPAPAVQWFQDEQVGLSDILGG